MLVIVGVSLTELTVSTKLSERVLLPSETVNVTVALPYLLVAGVMRTVRDEPLPVILILPVGNKVVFELERDTDKLPSVVSMSVTVKLTLFATSSLVL